MFKGTIKAFITRLFIPMFLFEAVVFTAIFGLRIIPDLIVIFLNMMIFNALCFMMLDKGMPFSEAFGAAQQANAGANFILAILLAILGGIHFGLTTTSKGVYVYLVLAFIANLLLWKRAYKISPEELNAVRTKE